jgi:hypothetical protein
MMKKIAVLMALVMVMAYTIPTFAAIGLSGSAETQLRLGLENQEWNLSGKTGIQVKTGFTAGGGNQVKAVVNLSNWELNSFVSGKPGADFTADYPSKSAVYPLTIQSMYLETDGAFWHGGPEVLTRIGDTSVNWNPYVAKLGNIRGIVIEGIDLDPVQAKAFYAMKVGSELVSPMGIQAKANIEGIDLAGTFVRHEGGNDIALEAGLEAVPGIRLDGYVALDSTQNTMYRVNATVDELIPSVVLKAGYRGYNEFNALYKDTSSQRPFDENTGFNIGLTTEQAGIGIAANYDHPTRTAVLSADTEFDGTEIWASTKMVNQQVSETKFGAKREIPLADQKITGEYNGKITLVEDAYKFEHTLKANTVLNMIPELAGLNLKGEVQMVDKSLDHWAIGTSFAAPNGINLGAEYHSVNGPSITAGLKASF